MARDSAAASVGVSPRRRRLGNILCEIWNVSTFNLHFRVKILSNTCVWVVDFLSPGPYPAK